MDTKSGISELKKKKVELLKKKLDLENRIKKEHPEAYKWLVEKEVNLQDMSKYSKDIAAALVIVASTLFYAPQEAKGISSPKMPVRVITADELSGLEEEQKARLVLERYGDIINEAAEKHDIDPKLIFSTIMVESGGNTFAIRTEPQIGDASYGLGQILYGTAVGIGYEGSASELYKPEVNVDLIAKYYRYNLDRYGSLTNEQLVTAYNAGNPYGYPLPGHINKFRKWYYGIADNLMEKETLDGKIAGI